VRITFVTSDHPAGRRLLPVACLVGALVAGACAAQPSPATGQAGRPAATAAAPPISPPASPVAPSPGAASPLPANTSPTVAEIARLRTAVAADPGDAPSWRDLGLAFLQRIRETADPSLYAPAAAAFEAARSYAPVDPLIYVGIGGLQLGKHEFAEALATGEEAIKLSPGLAAAHAVVVDALVELGRYDDADAAAGKMLALRSDLSTLARVSYLAELRGKLDVALTAMRLAARSPSLAPENTAYVESLLGNLLLYSGDPEGAAAAYKEALGIVPSYAPAFAGQARLAVGEGNLEEAISLFKRASDIVPLPEYVVALGDAQAAAGRDADAGRSYELAKAEIQLSQAAGVIVDLDLALFEADHGDPARALELAQTAYAAAPTVRAADALAWALHRSGHDKEAMKHSAEALRLGSLDALLRYHSGAIAAALSDATTARRDLKLALSTNPGFSATGAAEARRLLASLGSDQ
jgi:tetratricopeptide (TPR) repeat protein